MIKQKININNITRKIMKNIKTQEFQINKVTMRDLTPRELGNVAGGTATLTSINCTGTGATVTTPLTTVTLTTLTNQRH
jgi:hypothetical protein